MGDRFREPTPFSEDMPADGLRAAYENYHAARRALAQAQEHVAYHAGRLAELAAKVVQAGGEI